MPAAHQQPVLLATFAFYLATQLMPGAHPPAKYLCLLLGMQRKGKRGPLLGRYGHKGNSSAKAHKATGDPCLGATGTTFALAFQRQPLLLATCAFFLLSNATYARCASASKVPLLVVGVC
jgi:hypothetical protein